jgi:hypothetical protein
MLGKLPVDDHRELFRPRFILCVPRVFFYALCGKKNSYPLSKR